ncbi:MAG: class I SAM-dependent methyltransferase [Actinobacteria bacterium]|nr:class I SAM-dependent methyltransferase [Actinomycetota bacterium]
MRDRLGTNRYYGDPAVVKYYGTLDGLLQGEQALLAKLRPDLSRFRMLDLGVGAGRTTPYFAPFVREYVGTDVSPNMIDLCRSRFAERGWKHVQWLVADVKDMTEIDDDRFDFVLFSFNGLDSVGGDEERRRALLEIRRVSAPKGVFALSSHSLGPVPEWLSFRAKVEDAFRPPRTARKILTLPRDLVRTAILRAANPRLSEIAAADRAILTDTRHRARRVQNYYIRPEEQLRELEAAGFRDPRVLTAFGDELRGEAVADVRERWVDYLCKT